MSEVGQDLSFSSLSSKVDSAHSSLSGLPENYTFQLLSTSSLPLDLVSDMKDCVQGVLPESKLPDAKDWSIPHYPVGIIAPKENEIKVSDDNTSIVFFPGWGGTAASTLHIAAALNNEYAKDRPPNTTSAITFDSLVNPEPAVNASITSFPEHVADQAAIILNHIEKYKIKHVIPVIHSLAALDAGETILTLQALLKKRGFEDTKIDAIIFAQIPGLYPQHIKPLIERSIEIGTLAAESRYVFPSPQDIYETQQLIFLAQEGGDMATAHRLESVLKTQEERRERVGLPRIKEATTYTPLKGFPENNTRYTEQGKLMKYENLQYPATTNQDSLPFPAKEVWQELVNLDEQLERSVSATETKRLLNQRAQLLKSVINRTTQGPQIQEDRNNIFAVLSALRQTSDGYLNMKLVMDQLLNGIPANVRSRLNMPVGYMFAKKDVYFPSDEARKNVAKQEQKQATTSFPNSKSVAVGEILNWSHIAPSVNPEKFAENIVDMIKRITQPSAPASIELKYSG